MIYLKKYAKFRKEEGYILLCDCSTIQNYELPMDTYELLQQLKKGYDIKKPLGINNEKELINDLVSLDLVDEKENSNKGFHNQNWISIGYDESEFYK